MVKFMKDLNLQIYSYLDILRFEKQVNSNEPTNQSIKVEDEPLKTQKTRTTKTKTQ